MSFISCFNFQFLLGLVLGLIIDFVNGFFVCFKSIFLIIF